ncbi:MAG: protoheme IX farnesyltransferase, partial [Ilumatobacter sp.]|nr:protoheme IX farnesyltransferase [Ilumatobacter sp.]
VPMLPSVAPMAEVVKQMIGYTVALVVSTVVFWPVASLGLIYGISAIILGVIFILGTITLGKNPTAAASMRLFGYSITYVTLLFGAMMLDVFVEHGVS